MHPGLPRLTCCCALLLCLWHPALVAGELDPKVAEAWQRAGLELGWYGRDRNGALTTKAGIAWMKQARPDIVVRECYWHSVK